MNINRNESDFTFNSIDENDLTLDEVFQHIYDFIQHNPASELKLMIGTDSQAHPGNVRFITGIVIQRTGIGNWSCVHKTIVPGRMLNLHERISYETSLTEQVCSYFTKSKIDKLKQLVEPYKEQGGSLTVEGHIDIGGEEKNRTREFVDEMVHRIESFGLRAKIKPESFVASAYANKYTK